MSSERGGPYVVISKKQTGTAERIRYNALAGIALQSGRQVRMQGAEDGVRFGTAEPISPRQDSPSDFYIALELDVDETTFVPLRVPNYDGEVGNSFVYFPYTLRGAAVDSLSFSIVDEDNNAIYGMTYLKPVVVYAPQGPRIRQQRKSHSDFRTWDPYKTMQGYTIPETDFTQPGSYLLAWDGFNTENLFDSRLLRDKTLRARITATKGAAMKRAEVTFRLMHTGGIGWMYA